MMIQFAAEAFLKLWKTMSKMANLMTIIKTNYAKKKLQTI